MTMQNFLVQRTMCTRVKQLRRDFLYNDSPSACRVEMVSRKVVTLLAACLTVALTHTVLIGKKELRSFGCLSGHLDKTLIVHIFADTDQEYLENLKFFIQYGILQEDNAEYVILVQTNSSTIVRASHDVQFVDQILAVRVWPSQYELCAVCQTAATAK